MRKTLIITLGTLLVLSCSKPPAPQTPNTTQKNVESKPVESKPVELVVDAAAADQGEILYKQNCVFCHQADAIGKPGVAPSLTNKEFLSLASNTFIYNTVTRGRPGTGMPPFSHLGREKTLAIIAYLRKFSTLPSKADEINQQAKAKGDPQQGENLFNSICLSCHGVGGDGYASGGTGTAIGLPGFLSQASDGFIRTTIKQGRSNTRMRGFSGPQGLANLSDGDIDNIIVYLRQLNQ